MLAPAAALSWSATFKTTPHTATPAAVTFTDRDGTGDDTYTIPAVEGNDYLVYGSLTPAGIYPGTGTVVVTARAKPDFVLDPAAPASWSATFKSGPHTVTPAPVTFSDVDGTQGDTYTVPSVAGVDYLIGDLVVGPGTYPGTGTIAVTARARQDYVLAADAPASWSATFKAAPYAATPAAVTFNDVDGTQDDTFSIPSAAGVDYMVGGVVLAAGTYPAAGTVAVTARAQADYVLAVGAPASWSATFKATPYMATPAAVTFKIGQGTLSDTFTIPTAAGVDYLAGGKVLPAGTYPGAGTVTVTAQAKPDYVLTPGALTTWTAALRGSLIAAVPKITGTAKVGYTLTANAGAWGPGRSS